jgi:hypothetical protein
MFQGVCVVHNTMQTVCLAFIRGAYLMVSMSSRTVLTPRLGVAASVQATELGFATALSVLSRFKELMAQEGCSVDTLRMLRDAPYAAVQLEWGHTSTLEPLRQSTMRVFALLHD